MAAVAVFELKGRGPRGTGEQLVPHAYAEDGNVLLHSLFQMPDSRFAKFRISRAVGYEKSVVFQCVEVIVPRDAYEADSPLDEAPENVVLDPAVHEDHSLFPFSVPEDFTAADYGNLVLGIRVSDGEIPAGSFRFYDSGH